MRRSPAGSIVYADGTVFDPPTIHTSYGWEYKPDMLRTDKEIRQGKNKCWPRGTDDGSEWLKGYIFEHHQARGWEVPVSSTARNMSASFVHGDALHALYWTDLYGWTTLAVSVSKQGTDDTHRLSYSLQSSSLMGMLVEQKVVESGFQNQWSANATFQVKASEVSGLVQAFIHNPFETVTKRLAEIWTGLNLSNDVLQAPVEDLMDLDYQEDAQPERIWGDRVITTPIVGAAIGNGLFYRKGVIEEIFQDDVNWSNMEQFFRALRFTGYSVEPRWSYEYRKRDSKLTGIRIKIPKQGEMHAHVVDINATDPKVTITCGFMQDEDRWVERKQREAAEQMSELMEALEPTTYEIEL
jgi:hypothetical protein